MSAPKNKFKEGLTSGKVQIGCWAGFADTYATEMLATAGFDWLLLDGEHAPNDMRTMLAQLQVLAGFDVSPVVRLPVGNEVLIKQALDLGVQTLLIPMVETAQQARAHVASTRYPPHGRRGVGAALARASLYSQIPNYVTTANDEVCLLLQVENRAGLEALDEILTIEGVDGVFIGPADLSADMGYPGQAAHPEMQKLIKQTLLKIKASGKAAGILSLDDVKSQEYIDMGVEFTAVGIDVVSFVQSLRALADKFRQS